MQIIGCLLTTFLFLILSLQTFAEIANKKAADIIADFVEYDKNSELIYAKGNIKVTFDNYFITADNLLYDINDDIVWAEGNVKIKDDQDRIILGEKVILKDQLRIGVINNFILSLKDNTIVTSKIAEKISTNKSKLQNSKFTPCKITCNNKPIWQISAKKTEIDFDKHKMTYKHAFFEVYGVPILYVPYFSHPTPSAPAKSGILTPSIVNGSVDIPLYYIAKPNLDFTLTPRIFEKYQLFELESRYNPSRSSSIMFKGSYGNVPYFLEKNGQKIKNKKVNSYHFNIYGNFYTQNYLYGFNITRVSDKAYLKNYYQDYNSALESKIYFHKIKKVNYLTVEAKTFQGLGVNDNPNSDPLILPNIKTKNVINLNDNETTAFVVKNNTIFYSEKRAKTELARTSIDLLLYNNVYTNMGHVFYFGLQNRSDIYLIPSPKNPAEKKNKILTRNIPQIQTIWRYPLAGAISNKSTLMIEPIVSFIVGRKFSFHDSKFLYIDPVKYELSEENIFFANRYNGIDCHEFGNRLNFGVNSILSVNDNDFGLFLGQSQHTRYSFAQPEDNNENVGKISAKFQQQLELFYRFRKDNNFTPIRDEAGVHFLGEKFDMTASFIQLSNVRKYYAQANAQVTNNRARQLFYDLGYQLSDNIILGYSMRIDMPKSKIRILSKTIKVTYFTDCVRITGKISSDYMADGSRGIKKNSSLPTFTLGLKILNM